MAGHRDLDSSNPRLAAMEVHEHVGLGEDLVGSL
jgi:hypothetical protein